MDRNLANRTLSAALFSCGRGTVGEPRACRTPVFEPVSSSAHDDAGPFSARGRVRPMTAEAVNVPPVPPAR